MAIRNIIQKAEQEYPPVVGGITGVDLSNYVQSEDVYNAAVEWTQNHTLVDGTRYLIGDLVYFGGRIYKANYDNESIPVSDSLYWTDLGPGYRLNIDGRDLPNIPAQLPDTIVYTTGNQTISGNKTFEADEYIFSGSSLKMIGNSIFSVAQQTQTQGIVKDRGGASGMQVLTTGAYNAITPLSGVVYILI